MKSTTVENVEHGMKKMDSYGLGVTEAVKGGIMSSVLGLMRRIYQKTCCDKCSH